MSDLDSIRAEMADRLDAPFWVKAWNWMFNREWDFNPNPPYEPPNKEEAIALLDAQGRHRSEWCYADYDGRRKWS